MAPLPGRFLQAVDQFNDCGELCRDSRTMARGGGMGFVDLVGGLVGGVANIWAAKEQTKAASKMAKVQAQAIKAQRENDARAYAVAQAQMQAIPYEKKRNIQLWTLATIGGAAAIVSGIFILAAIKSRGQQ